jgi:hypothetical protein
VDATAGGGSCPRMVATEGRRPEADDDECTEIGSDCPGRDQWCATPREHDPLCVAIADFEPASPVPPAPPSPPASHRAREDSTFVVPGVRCLGCLLSRSVLRPVEDFVRRNAARLPEAALWRSTAAVYEQRVRTSYHPDSVAMPPWSAAEIERHFADHELDPYLTALCVARELRVLRETLSRQLEERREATGAVDPRLLRLVAKVGRAETQRHAALEARERREALEAARANGDEASSGARSSPRKRARRSRTRRGPATPERPRGTPGAPAAAADPRVAPMDASVAAVGLRDFLSSYCRPCIPPSPPTAAAHGTQRTLAEAWCKADASDVMQRHRQEERLRFQVEGRCYCAGRNGSGCCFALDRAFETALCDSHPSVAAHFTKRGEAALIEAIRDAMQLGGASASRAPMKLRMRRGKTVVFGWRRYEHGCGISITHKPLL